MASVISGSELRGKPQVANVSTKRRLRGGDAPPNAADPGNVTWEYRVGTCNMELRPCALSNLREKALQRTQCSPRVRWCSRVRVHVPLLL